MRQRSLSSIRNLFLFVFALLYSFQVFADGLTLGEFPHLSGVPRLLHDAEYLQFQRPDGLILKGAALGPADGEPILISPGYFGSAAYLAEVAHGLAAQGYRVYIYSLRGKGKGALRSNFRLSRQDYPGQFGFDEMVNDKIALIDAIYKLHQQPLVIMGHSLSGLIVRAVTLGLRLTSTRHYVDPVLRKKLSKQVKRAFVFKSPSPVLSKPAEFGITMTLREKWNMLKAQFLILNAAPFMSRFKNNILAKAAGAMFSLVPFKNQIAKSFLYTHEILFDDIVRTKDFNGPHYFERLMHATAERIEPDIVDDLSRFIKEGFLTRRGLDIADVYFDRSTLHERVPVTIISGENDILALRQFTDIEARFLGYEHAVIGSSHMTGIMGESAKVTVEYMVEVLEEQRSESGFKARTARTEVVLQRKAIHHSELYFCTLLFRSAQ